MNFLTRRDFAKGAGAVALASGCRRKATTPAARLPPDTNVLLVILDTVSAASVSSFGLGKPLTPAIDRLAAAGVAFQNTFSPAPWTKPAFSSMFTGLMPNRCGMSRVTAVLDPRFETLATAFAKKSFQTSAVISHFLVGARFGMGQGYARYDETPSLHPRPHETITSRAVTDTAVNWLDARGRGPFFLTVHFFDPHYNFYHHKEFDRTSGYSGPLKPGLPIDVLLDMRPHLTAVDIDYLRNLYFEEIAFTDHHLARLIDYLDKAGLADNTLVILAADHGEEFMQRGWIGHTISLHNELIHVPLLFRLPGTIRPGVCRTPVSTLDLWPTLADLFGLPPPAYGLDGCSMAPLLEAPDDAGDPGRAIFSEVDYVPLYDRKAKDELIAFKTALVMDGHKLIHNRRDESWLLYDLAADPAEKNSLLGQRPFENALRRELTRWEKARNPIRVDAPDFLKPDEIEKLKSLGYLR